MKKLFFALALLMLSSQGVFAASCNPDTDNFTIGGWCVNKAGTLVPKTTTGGVQDLVETVSVANTPRTMLITESGKVLTDTGGAATPTVAAGCSKYTLPRAAPGLTYTFSTGAQCFITVDTVDGSDTILNSISGTGFAAGESLKSPGQAGDTVTVTSGAANKWSITAMRGSWTNNAGN